MSELGHRSSEKVNFVASAANCHLCYPDFLEVMSTIEAVPDLVLWKHTNFELSDFCRKRGTPALKQISPDSFSPVLGHDVQRVQERFVRPNVWIRGDAPAPEQLCDSGDRVRSDADESHHCVTGLTHTETRCEFIDEIRALD